MFVFSVTTGSMMILSIVMTSPLVRVRARLAAVELVQLRGGRLQEEELLAVEQVVRLQPVEAEEAQPGHVAARALHHGVVVLEDDDGPLVRARGWRAS